MGETIKELIKFASHHFDTEEKYFKKFVEDTDGETEYAGKCIVGGADEADIEVLLF